MAVGIPLVAVTVADERVGIAAALLYALAFTLELAVSLVAYFGAEAQGVRRLLASRRRSSSRCPRSRSPPTRRGEEEKFDPASEWTLHEWVPIHLGPLDMSINKAVAYLLLGALVSCVIGIVFMRVKVGQGPDRKQAVGEMIYEIAQVQVAEQGLPTKAIGRWFPYVASLMVFIWVVNMLGFIPLPLSDEKVEIAGVEVPTLALFAATSTLSVTLALALMTFVFTHVEGIRANGVDQVLQELDPRRAEADAPADHPARDPRPVHAPDQPLGPSLREHARRAHADPHVPRPDLHHRQRLPRGRSPFPRRPSSTSSRS